MDPFQLRHVGVRATSQGPDVLELGEAVDLDSTQQEVAGQAGADRDEHDDDQVATLVG